jgi:hypothetical protein
MKNFYLKSSLLVTFAILSTLNLSAQVLEKPEDPSKAFPTIMVKDYESEESSPLKMASLSIDVTIIGMIATTTMQMTFQNDSSRILEGEFYFPLDEGQTISRFALDVNGKLREGVVVEKAKGQSIFENTIRRQIDPGLLEWTKGNNFKARIYPIPANGTKTLLIAYEQELTFMDGHPLYLLPLKFQEVIEKFNLKLQVHHQDIAPTLDSEKIPNLIFIKSGNGYEAEVAHSNVFANKTIRIIVPQEDYIETIYIEKDPNGETYFFVNLGLRTFEIPGFEVEKISIVWDASSSSKERNFENEFALLDDYFKHFGSVEVELIVFSNAIHSDPTTLKVKKGNWSKLKEKLLTIQYDGGTQLGVLNLQKEVDQILLFTDGISNFGEQAIKFGTTPIICINSKLPAEHAYLNHLGDCTGGRYINLNQVDKEEALSMLIEQPLRFLSAEYITDEIDDVTPSTGINSGETFSFAGRLRSDKTRVKLHFGFNAEIKETLEIDLNSTDSSDYSGFIRRMWAQKKLEELDADYVQNKEEIITLAKTHSIVTRGTSLIVLDRIEDYLINDITPPPGLIEEFKEDYEDFIEGKEQEIEEKVSTLEATVKKFEQRKEWWNKKFTDYDSLLLLKSTMEKALKTINTDCRLWQKEYASMDHKITRLMNKMHGQVLEWEQMQSDFDTTKAEWSKPVNRYTKLTNKGLQTHYVKENSIILDSLFKDWRKDFPIQNRTLGDSIERFHKLIVNMEEAMNRIDEDHKKWLADFDGFENEIGTLKEADSCNLYSWTELEERISHKTANWLRDIGYYRAQGENGLNYNYVKHRKKTLLKTHQDWEETITLESQWMQDTIAANIVDCPIPPGFYDLKVTKDELKAFADYEQAYNAYNNESEMNSRLSRLTDLMSKDAGRTSGSPIKLKAWDPDMPYLTAIKAASKKERYQTYLIQKKEYGATPSFYVDVADYFKKEQEHQLALRVISNIAELETQNHELLRLLGFKLKDYTEFDLAIPIFNELKEMRSEEPQSFRDLALIYAADQQYQKAIHEFYQVATRTWSRFADIEIIALNEMNVAIFEAEQAGIKLNLSEIDPRLIKNMPVKLRVILDWNADNTDMDLWVEEPAGEICKYSHNRTETGGRMSRDFTAGYGPEEYQIKRALPGTYVVKANFYGSSRQKISGPITVHLQLFFDYGTANEKMEEITVRLSDASEVIEIGQFIVD